MRVTNSTYMQCTCKKVKVKNDLDEALESLTIKSDIIADVQRDCALRILRLIATFGNGSLARTAMLRSYCRHLNLKAKLIPLNELEGNSGFDLRYLDKYQDRLRALLSERRKRCE